MSSWVYRGHLLHLRRTLPRNRFRYPVCFFAFELDDLAGLDARLRLFGHNRARPVALHDRDYLDGAGGLAASVRRRLGARDPGGAITLVTHARVLGYVFNPVSFFLCHDRAGALAEVIAEVNNTYGGSHRYLLERRAEAWEAEKALYVSPFLPEDARYRFRFPALGPRLDVRADLLSAGTSILHARLIGLGRPLDDRALLRALLRAPLSTMQVIARIHLQALKLRLLGAPRAPAAEGTVITRRLFLAFLSRWREGQLVVRLPDGSRHVFGDPAGGSVTLEVVDEALFRRVLLGGELAAADAYVEGLWRTDDLGLFLLLFARNLEGLQLDRGVARLGQLGAWLRHRVVRNTRRGAARNVRAHYDLGNDLYRLFLDEEMVYSCALWDGAADLEAAQRRKLETVCDKLDLGPGDHLLDLGCGWGGLARHAARTRGCRVTAVTISREQADLARGRAAGLDRVDVRLCDWRDVTGHFTAIASIEMIEALGDEHLAPFFGACATWLRGGGHMLLQTITIPDERWDAYRRGVDWMQTRIFPGAVIPSPGALRAAVSAHLEVRHVEEIGPHYAPTLAAWRARFLAASAELPAQARDARFRRAWELYLAFSEAQFATGRLGDVQMLLERIA